jgi:8-oxo-dGTP pyrophosphatase MutT (NUDIX family)
MEFARYRRRVAWLLHHADPPGFAAQRRLAPEQRFSSDYEPEPPGARRAAVLMLLVPWNEEVALPLIRRPEDGSPHGGQIALPGGAWEYPESFPEDTAVREAEEELGIPPADTEILGTLTPLFIPVSNFTVFPVVAGRDAAPTLRPDPSEVAGGGFVPLCELAGEPAWGRFPSRRRRSGSTASRDASIRAPYWRSRMGTIWGATAMMLAELVELHRMATVDGVDG